MRGNVVIFGSGCHYWRVSIGVIFRFFTAADIIMPPLGLLIGGIDLKQFALRYAKRRRCLRRSSCAIRRVYPERIDL